jgi:hypothetical protein
MHSGFAQAIITRLQAMSTSDPRDQAAVEWFTLTGAQAAF